MLLRICALMLLPQIGCAQTPPSELVSGPVGAKLDDYLSRCSRFGFSGAVLIARGGKVLLRKGYGLANAAQGTPVRPQTLFDIASATKPMTAAAILKLEMRGKLAISDPISKYLPGVPASWSDVTIRHLLSHTSGAAKDGPIGYGPDLAHAMKEYFKAGITAGVGTRFAYYNGGYAMLAAIIQIVSRKDYTTFMRDEIFKPAGMKNSGFCGDKPSDMTLVARGRHRGEDAGSAFKDSYGWEYRGMAGVVSSVIDLYAWDRALRANQVLPAAVKKRMFRPILPGYGLGWHVSKSGSKGLCVEHPGNVRGFESAFKRFVERDAVVILLSNREKVRWQVARNLVALLFDEPPLVEAVPVFKAWSTEELSAVQGTYDVGEEGRLVVSAGESSLIVGAEGQAAIEILEPGAARSSKSGSRARLEKLARKVLDGLAQGDVSALLDLSRPAWFAEHFARAMKTTIWPRQLRRWGPWRSHVILGTRHDSGEDRDEVFGRVLHEKGHAGFKMVFSKGRLVALNLDGPEFPLRVVFVPETASRCVTYDYGRPTAPPISFVRDGNGRVTGMRLHGQGRELIAARIR